MPERAGVIGGKLAVWSEVSAGTEVELRLPAGRLCNKPEAPMVVTRVGPEHQQTKERRPMSGDTSRIRILAVDDHPVVRQGIKGLVDVQPE